MNFYPLNLFYLFILNLSLFIVSTILLIVRIKKWKVSLPVINLIKIIYEEKRLNFFEKLKIIINTLFNDLITLKRAGGLCEEPIHLYGRYFLIYGFIGAVVMNLINAVINPEGISLGFLHPLSMISYLSYSFLALGSLILLFRRLVRINLRRTTDKSVWFLHLSLFYFSITGIILFTTMNLGLSFFSLIFYFLYLSSICLLYLFLPLSEFGYFVWKGSTLFVHAILDEAERIKR